MRYFVVDDDSLFREPEQGPVFEFWHWRRREWVPAVGPLFPSFEELNHAHPISAEQAERMIAGESYAGVAVKPPPWTPGGFVDAIRDAPVKPSGDQTREQALNMRIAAYRYACKLDGIEPPSEAEINYAP